MGSMLRSDLMTLCDVYLQREAGFETLSQLGEMGCVQFLDLNVDVQPFDKHYVSDLCRCAEMERKLRYMESEMIKDKIAVTEAVTEPKALQPNEMLPFENVLEKWEDDIIEMTSNHVTLLKRYMELSEMYYVLEHIGPLLGDTEFSGEDILAKRSTPSTVEAGTLGQLIILTGIVKRSTCYTFEMMLWRISRGNIYYKQAKDDKLIKDPKTGLEIRKVAFLAICQGEELSSRMQKVCSGFRVNIYPCPKTYDERIEMLSELGFQIVDLDKVIATTHFHRCKALRVIARQWDVWMIQVRKAKAIYHNLNLFNLDITKNCLIGQCWIPNLDLQQVQNTLEKASETVGTNVPSFMSKTVVPPSGPPTFHRTNKFTHGFQALISAYGDSTYREINPGLFTVVTFPFLFGLMFGDIGHGFILLLFASWMVLKEKQFLLQKSTNEIWNIFFGGRYVILLLAVFSMYAGFIYNDIFSKSINIYGSYWRNHYGKQELMNFEQLTLNPSLNTSRVYWFGLDPIWTISANQIIVENSVKMKFSIIIGIIHMMFGIVISLFDHIYFKRYHAIAFEFIPKIVFLVCIFCWLVFMIFFKWFVYGAKETDIVLRPGCAPQVLILFIDMALLSETKAIDPNCQPYMFDNQRSVQMCLIVIGLLCVPILLFGTPLFVMRRNKKRRDEAMKKMVSFRRYQRKDTNLNKVEEQIAAELVRYNTPFGELMIHQGVETIEYVLSTISHTASYLRLWALSLAHAELSAMLWKMVLRKGLHMHTKTGAIGIFLAFSLWAFFTMSILVMMEGMSAFLHTLRLHWVEFMSKFFLGRGWMFKPFSFSSLLASDEDKFDNVCKKRAKQEPETGGRRTQNV